MRSFFLFALSICVASALTTVHTGRANLVASKNQFQRSQDTAIFSTPEEPNSPPPGESDGAETPVVAAVPEPEEESKYPIDLPSPILLSTSMVLGIAGTGSGFELAGGEPSLGFATTAAITAVSIPLCLFLFYASILKATAETEADDAEYMKGKY